MVLTLAAALLGGGLAAQPPTPKDPPKDAKGPDKEVAERIATLKQVLADKTFARDAEGIESIDKLVMKMQAGVDPKDQADIVKALEGVLTTGKQRPPEQAQLYLGAAQALGYFGPKGAKVLHAAYNNKRYPDKPEWVSFREHLLKNLGRTKDEGMVKFLVEEAVRSPQIALAAAAGEALGNFEESKEAIRKEIVADLLKNYGELDEKASQLGTNLDAQNAKDRLAAVSEKWNTTLGKLTRQNFSSFRDWQTWYNKNKGVAW